MSELLTTIEEVLGEGFTLGMYLRLPYMLIGIATYVFSSLGLFTIAQRRGIHHAWLSWIPVGNLWVLGALSDQYQYLTRGENRVKRKTLLTLSIIVCVLAMVIVLVCGVMLVRVIRMAISDADIGDFTELGFQLVGLLILLIPYGILTAVYSVIYYITLFDLFRSTDPRNRWLYLILCLLCVYALPLILFFNRDRDDGMPPRLPEAQIPPPYHP